MLFLIAGNAANFCIHEVPFCNRDVPSVMISNQNCLLAYNNCIIMQESNCKSTDEDSVVCDELCVTSLMFENNVKILATCDKTSYCQEVKTFCNGSALRVPLWRAKFNHHQSGKQRYCVVYDMHGSSHSNGKLVIISK